MNAFEVVTALELTIYIAFLILVVSVLGYVIGYKVASDRVLREHQKFLDYLKRRQQEK